MNMRRDERYSNEQYAAARNYEHSDDWRERDEQQRNRIFGRDDSSFREEMNRRDRAMREDQWMRRSSYSGEGGVDRGAGVYPPVSNYYPSTVSSNYAWRGGSESGDGSGYNSSYGVQQGHGQGYDRDSVEARGWGHERGSQSWQPSQSWNSARSYRGMGPKGYRRTDERLREQICEVLTDNDQIDASDLDVIVKDGEITLTGTVEDRRMKVLAERIAESFSSQREVRNSIRIRRQVDSTRSGEVRGRVSSS